MKLSQLKEEKINQHPMYCWFAPSRGPNDIPGVELRYIQPLELHYDILIKNAEDEQKVSRVRRLKDDREAYRKRGQTHFTPSIDWWMSKEDFEAGKEGFSRLHKGEVLTRYPNIRIFDSEKDAIETAKRDNLI